MNLADDVGFVIATFDQPDDEGLDHEADRRWTASLLRTEPG